MSETDPHQTPPSGGGAAAGDPAPAGDPSAGGSAPAGDPAAAGSPSAGGHFGAGGSSAGSAPAGRPPLRRRADDRALAGVCAAVARHLGVDAVIVRIAVVALAFAGGAGVLAYLAGWLLIPAESGGEVSAPGTFATVAGAVVLVLAAAWVLPGGWPPFDGPVVGLTALAALGALMWFVSRNAGADGADLARRTGQGLLVVGVSGLLAVAAFWISAAGGDLAMAVVVLAAGLALVVAAFAGGARWLVLPAFAVALGVAVVAASGIDLRGGIGERQHRPGSLTEIQDRYRLGAGELVIDLRDVDFGGRTQRIGIDVGLGEARVLVPPGTCVGGTARIGVGSVELLDRDSGGFDVDVDAAAPMQPGAGKLLVDAEIGLGELDVDTLDQPDGGFADHWGDDDAPAVDAATGCAA